MSDVVADPPIGRAPGQRRFGAAVERFDELADARLEVVRGHPIVDRVFTVATDAGEFSLIWHACSVARGVARRRPDQIVALGLGIAAESLLVNQGLKRIFRRQRPTEAGDERFEIRRPLTSSFPSGHASAAAFAATTLIRWDGRSWAPVWAALGASVAISRPYVRIHHASDVVGGLAVGVLLAAASRPLFRRAGVE